MTQRSTNTMFQGMNKWADGSFKLLPFLVFVGILVIGIIFFAEDTISSYEGVLLFEQHYGLRSVTWGITYWAVSLTPQLAQVALFYIFLSDTKNNKWALAGGIIFLVIDFGLDTMYRSNGYIGDAERAGAIGLNTFVFSMLSEFFISLGAGYALVMAKPLWEKASTELPLGPPRREPRSARRQARQARQTLDQEVDLEAMLGDMQ